VIAVELEQLRRLAPDLILTQGLCEVCAVSDGVVHRMAEALSPPPRVLALRATSLAGIFDDIRAVARAIDLEDEADELVAGLASRLARLQARHPALRPRVVCLEWLDPPYLAGHWVPELVAAAGGADIGALPGSHSTRGEWEEIAALGPDVVAVMLCGFGLDRSRQELAAITNPAARALLSGRPAWILDGNAYTSRPGPRVVDGAEKLQAMLQGREASGLSRWRAPWPPT
jgi:iron complex transport system substrate-binding protein